MDPIKQLQRFVRDLLQFNEQQIKDGRRNFEDLDFSQELIVADELDSSPEFLSSSYDGDIEEMSYNVSMKGSFTLDFFGTNAKRNAVKFVALLRSQKAFELQRDLGISIQMPTNINDLRRLTGIQYSNRYQTQFEMRYNESETEDIKRIDIAQVEINTEQEIIQFETES